MGEISAKVQGLLRRAKARKSSVECWLRRWTLQLDLQNVEKNRGGRRRRRNESPKLAAPKGYLPIRVFEEEEEEDEEEGMEVFVKAEMLNHPVVAELLRGAAEEYSYGYTGALRLTCDAITLEKALNRAMTTCQRRSSSSRRRRRNGEQKLLLRMKRRVHP